MNEPIVEGKHQNEQLDPPRYPKIIDQPETTKRNRPKPRNQPGQRNCPKPPRYTSGQAHTNPTDSASIPARFHGIDKTMSKIESIRLIMLTKSNFFQIPRLSPTFQTVSSTMTHCNSSIFRDKDHFWWRVFLEVERGYNSSRYFVYLRLTIAPREHKFFGFPASSVGKPIFTPNSHPAEKPESPSVRIYDRVGLVL